MVHRLVASLFVVALGALVACRAPDDVAASHPEGSGESVAAVSAEGSGDVLDVVADGAPSDVVVPVVEAAPEPALPPERSVEIAGAAAEIGSSGGLLVAGAMSVSIPAGALDQSWMFDVGVVGDAEALDAELPGGLMLGAWRGVPWNPLFSRPVELTLPLSRTVEPGADIELLAWHPQMRSWLVIGHARADEQGASITTSVRQLGEMVARGAPVPRHDAVCEGSSLRMHDAWPGESEDEVVGLTEVVDRIPREVAFNLLTDMRLSPDFDLIEFKNEEVNDLSGTRRDERNHRDEDYLFDPNAAAATAALARLVRDEWADPYTGEPTHRLRVTEAFDNFIEHSERSTHYQGRAVDLTVTPIPAPAPDERAAWYGHLSRLAICAGYDYVLFENQFHVHASVTPTRVAVLLEDGAQRTVATASLPHIDGRQPSGVTFASSAVEPSAFEYVAPGRFELQGAPGSNERYTLTRRGLEPAAAPAVPAHPPVAQTVALEHDAGDVTVDGMRRIVVRDGRAYLVNTSSIPPLGSVDADGTPVHIEYPYPLSLPDEVVLGASFQRHGRTAEALARGAMP